MNARGEIKTRTLSRFQKGFCRECARYNHSGCLALKGGGERHPHLPGVGSSDGGTCVCRCFPCDGCGLVKYRPGECRRGGEEVRLCRTCRKLRLVKLQVKIFTRRVRG